MKNLLGLSGKKQSGKDTIAKIIQYHTDKHPPNVTLEEFIDRRWWSLSLNTPTWEIKKYADKLKEIVCLLLGCTREQLEDNDFKEKELSEDWWTCTVDNINGGCNGTKVVAYLDVREFDEVHDTTKTTPRLLLQLLGTECGRKIIHPQIWVTSLFADYHPIEGKMIPPQYPKDYTSGLFKFPNWLITDVRFENEVDAIKQRGGIVIRVNRVTGNSLIDNDTHSLTDWQHPSETALDNYENFDYIISNDGDLTDLEQKVLTMMDYFEIPYNK